MVRQIVLVGLSGTGKSSVARVAAASLGWEAFDTDQQIEQETGRTIPDIFRTDGEAAFRQIEAQIMRTALDGDRRVIATGGGAVIDPSIWSEDLLGHPDRLVVWLDTSPEVLVDRLRLQAQQEGGKAERPLLEGDPLARISGMRHARSGHYGKARIRLDVTHRDAAAIGSDIAELATLAGGGEVVQELRVEAAESTIRVGPGASIRLGEIIRHRWPKASRVWVVADANLLPHAGAVIDALASDAGPRVNVLPVPPGEGSKSLEGLSRVYDWMLDGGVQRGDVAVALGGGMVGDLTGFAAASVLRGIGLVQVPTTLLSMVDSSVGGKTGINHRTGKNLIGAFYQPPEVVIDPNLLGSMPPRELRSGWAEIVKHGVIEPSTPGGRPPVLFDLMEQNLAALDARSQPLLSWVIRRNVSLKAAVVAADEREAGLRAILNFGHTIGHGIEAAGYHYLHGEAVALGTRAACAIAVDLNLIDQAFADRVGALLDGFGLPDRGEIDAKSVLQRMASDKKKEAGVQKWVLPVREGGVRIVTDVPESSIDAAIASVSTRNWLVSSA